MTPPDIPSNHDQTPVRILIVDDMEQVRKDLRFLLQVSGEVEVIGEASNGEEAIQQAALLQPDVVVMDLEMPVLDGIQATAQIKQRKLAECIVILTVHSEPIDKLRALQAGADFFITKGSSYSILIDAITKKKEK